MLSPWLLRIFLLLTTFSGKAQPVFSWKWQVVDGQLHISSRINEQPGTTVTVNLDSAKRRFAVLYHIIDEVEYNRQTLYQLTIDTLSYQLVRPFAAAISSCSSMVIQADSNLLNFPVEWLEINKVPLAIFRPMVFTFTPLPNPLNDSLRLSKGFIIRDITSDPENACGTTLRRFPESYFKMVTKIKSTELIKQPGNDFILISAHGSVDTPLLRGDVAVGRHTVQPSFLQWSNPPLIYIDACQQGINFAYINALAQTAAVNFYTGPIISNDSGESSTKTINWFFSFLQKEYNPVIAMWKTRQKLYRYYKNKWRKMDVINKSFIFRMYRV
jgi:hypothetical protein